jgi:hypothetical protein
MKSLMEIVKALEQESIDALIFGNAERTQWINKGNYIKIVFWDKTGKPTDAHPHIETLLKRLAGSNLPVKRQQEILKDCEDHAAIQYLKSLQQKNLLDSQIKTDQLNDEHFGF